MLYKNALKESKFFPFWSEWRQIQFWQLPSLKIYRFSLNIYFVWYGLFQCDSISVDQNVGHCGNSLEEDEHSLPCYTRKYSGQEEDGICWSVQQWPCRARGDAGVTEGWWLWTEPDWRKSPLSVGQSLVCLHKGDRYTFMGTTLSKLFSLPSEKGSTWKVKNFLSLGANSFL